MIEHSAIFLVLVIVLLFTNILGFGFNDPSDKSSADGIPRRSWEALPDAPFLVFDNFPVARLPHDA